MYANLLSYADSTDILDTQRVEELPGYEEAGNFVFTQIQYSEIKKELTPFFWACKNLNDNIEVFGLPHGQGYLQERPTVLEIRKIFVSEKIRYENWKLTQMRA